MARRPVLKQLLNCYICKLDHIFLKTIWKVCFPATCTPANTQKCAQKARELYKWNEAVNDRGEPVSH